MALSNWDTLAFGPDGKVCGGEFKSVKTDHTLELYKNWAHIGSPKSWQEHGSHSSPYIASINSGNTTIGPFSIEAERHEGQNSIFIYASEYIFQKDEVGSVARRFVGIGCYGFKNEAKLVLEKLGRMDEFDKFEWITMSTYENGVSKHYVEKCDIETCERLETIEIEKMDLDELWEGVNKETLKAFFEWLDTLANRNSTYPDKDFCAWIDVCKSAKPESFNQGDAYFAEQVGTEIPKSEVGTERPTPVLHGILKELKNKE